MSLVIVGTSLVYAGFFGLLAALGVYLVGVELMSISMSWVCLPVGIALIVGLASGLRGTLDYWRNYGNR